MTTGQIAGALFSSPKTVETNRARASAQAGISSRAERGRVISERERLTATQDIGKRPM
jgi:hypothetical protein